MSYLFDTHAVLWTLHEDPRLGENARRLVGTLSPQIFAIASISLLEISLLAARGKIREGQGDLFALGRLRALCQTIEISPEIAHLAPRLPLPHRDPFDRVIVATAVIHGLTLVTKDRAMNASGLVPVIW